MVLFYGFGQLIFWVSLIVAGVLFGIYRKIHPVFYLSSVALYIYTAGFVIAEYSLGKGWILGILVFSAIVFMLLGYYLSKSIKKTGKNLDSSMSRKKGG